MTSNNEQLYFIPAAPGFSVLDCDHRPEPAVLSASARSALNRALEYEEATILAGLRGLNVVIDVEGPL